MITNHILGQWILLMLSIQMSSALGQQLLNQMAALALQVPATEAIMHRISPPVPEARVVPEMVAVHQHATPMGPRARRNRVVGRALRIGAIETVRICRVPTEQVVVVVRVCMDVVQRAQVAGARADRRRQRRRQLHIVISSVQGHRFRSLMLGR